MPHSSIDAGTRLVALLGSPVHHSLSPLIHNAAFGALGLNYRYLAFHVAPGDLPRALSGLRALGFAGANVTIPHKRAVFSLVDETTDVAAAVEAVNTLFWMDDRRMRLGGHNTDVEGFSAPLEPFRNRLNGSPALVLGAGGSARAVVHALLSDFHCRPVIVAARNPQKAADLASVFGTGDVVRRESLGELNGESIREAELIVNATPVGMHPESRSMPLRDASSLTERHIVYDLIYNPVETVLLAEAGRRGAATIGGLEMLIQQAAGSFRLWTGTEMPVETVRETLRKSLSTDAG